ncbi:AIR synthase family protein [Flavitalea sp.]|nr:AIR synthase family protein [Flavitalea sp.]
MFLSGKIENEAFEEVILKHCGFQRNEVSTGPGFGIDVSVIDLPGQMAMALTSDPLSLIPSLGLQESAWLSVHLMANDMATTGFAPMYVQMVLNLPVSLSKHDFKIYWHFVHKYCHEAGISITGGHTGGIEGQRSTIAGGGTMLLTAPKEKIRISKNAQAGNVIILTKECGISSAAILAMSFPETVKNKLGKEIYDEGCRLFYQTSSLKDGLVAADNNSNFTEVTAMHDVTEGGVLGAVYEMAIASGNGVWVDNNNLPAGSTTQKICNLFELDHRFCIGAGAMIIAAEKEKAQNVLQRLQQNNISATVIGEFKEKQFGYKLIEDLVKKPMPYFSKDPYWDAFFLACNKGLK